MFALWPWLYEPPTEPGVGAWGGWPGWVVVLLLLAALGAGFAAGAAVFEAWPWLQRMLVPASVMRRRVEAEARRRFYDLRVRHTAGGSGVLLYVSLLERIAVVLPDEAIEGRLGEDAAARWCAQLTAALQKGDAASALAMTIEAMQTELARAMPREAGDVNELPDALVEVG